MCYAVRGRALGICQGEATTLLHCGAVCGGGVREGIMSLASFYPIFCHFPHFPQADCALSGTDSQVGGFVYVLGLRGPLQWTLQWHWDFLPLPQPPQLFTARGFASLVSCSETLSFVVCVTPRCSSQLTTQSASTHLTWVVHSLATHPLCPAAHLCPSYQSGWMFL